MVEQQARKRRRRRRGRRGVTPADAAPVASDAPARSGTTSWQWRTFPVFCAFVFGAFLILLIAPEPRTGLYSILFFGFLGACAFAVAHIATRTLMLIARRRRR